MKLGCLFLIISSVNFSVRVVMFRVVDIESTEISTGPIGAAVMGSVGISIGVIAIEVIVID
jgi:hypothetical protein